MTTLDANDPKQTLIAGYLPAEPPAGMMQRAAARYRAKSEQDRYLCFVYPHHVGAAEAIKIAREKGLSETFKIEHQLAKDARSAPVITARWIVDEADIMTAEAV